MTLRLNAEVIKVEAEILISGEVIEKEMSSAWVMLTSCLCFCLKGWVAS